MRSGPSRFWRSLLLVLLSPCGVADGQSGDGVDFQPARSDGPIGLDLPDDVKTTRPKSPFARHRGAIARVLGEAGSQRILIDPTGGLVVAPASAAPAAAGPFQPASTAAIIRSLRAQGLEDFEFERAGYYLYATKCTPAYYAHTRSILESMLSGVVQQLRAWQLDPQRPQTPLVVIIMPSRAAFDAWDEMPEGVAAYYNGVSNHVVMYEDDRLFDAAPEFALKQGSYIVAHEAIHQILHNTGIQQRLSAWPAWISEGVPEYFCPLRVTSNLTKLDGDELPVRTVKWAKAGMVNDIRMHDLLRTRPAAGALIREVVSAPGLTAHGYSVAWGLTHYLAERRPEEFAAYLAEIKKVPALSRLSDNSSRGPDALFVKHFGDDFASLEKDVQKHLTSKPLQKAYRDPFVHQTHYVVSVTYKKSRVYYTRAGVALSPQAAREWTTEQRKNLRSEGLTGHILTRRCKTAREAQFQLRKILN